MITVVALSDEYKAEAEALAKELQLPFGGEAALHLVVGERLELREANSRTGPVYVDFVSLNQRPKRGKDLIAKALGIKGGYRPTVLDATAGLGQDAFILVTYGCEVRMCERSPIVYALLRDGLERAKADSEIAAVISKLSLELADAKTMLSKLSEAQRPDVVYLDPMYPETGKSAAKRKEMRLFRDVVGDDTDFQELFKVGLETATKRVVVKRPVKASELAKPTFVLEGTTVRFDVYVRS